MTPDMDKWRSIGNQAVILYELIFVRLVNANYLFYGVVLLAQTIQTLSASVQPSRSNPLHDVYHNCRRKKRQIGTALPNSVTVLLGNGRNAKCVTQKPTMSTIFKSEVLLPTVTSTVTALREFVRLTCHKRRAYWYHTVTVMSTHQHLRWLQTYGTLCKKKR
jgi:hypothetical protein